MIRSVLGCIGLGITFFLVAAHADSILRVNDPVLGDPTATISGQVTNSRGKLLDGAIVEATGLESQLIVGAKTNKDGSYRMAFLPPGTYSVAARMAGFRTVSNPSFKVEAQDKIALNFCMDCGAVPNSSTGGGGGTGAGSGAGATGGGSSMRSGTTTQSIVNNPLTLAGSASLVPNSSINDALQLQLGANGSTQQVPVSLNSSMSYGASGNLHADSYDHVSALKGDDESLLNLSGNDSGSILAIGQLNTIPARPTGSELAGGYGLLPVSFAAQMPNGVGTSWKVAVSETQLEGAQSTEKIIVSSNNKSTGDVSSEQFVAALDSEGNGITEPTVSIVSEPSCLLMMGTGMIGLAIVTRRYKHKM